MKANQTRIAVFFAMLIFAISTVAQTATFTYQGRLTDTSMPANGHIKCILLCTMR